LFRQQDREDEAEALLQKGLANVPDAPEVHHALGLLLVRNQRLDEALAALRQATELAADQPRYAYVYALAIKEKGELGKAITTLEAARRRHPGDRDVLSALTTLYLEHGDREAARQAAKELKERYPDDPEAKFLWEQASAR
ncbi:MAG: tetratricopeptide repeat protein, partial [Gammaproteobacteria bacterium]